MATSHVPLIQETLAQFEQSELILALVCPVGVNYARCLHILQAEFKKLGYQPQVISMSSLMDNLCTRYKLPTAEPTTSEAERIRSRMNQGNDLRRNTNSPELMALAAIREINQFRVSALPDHASDEIKPLLKTVHILATLKRPEEVEILRKVYGTGFFLIGIHDSEKGRRDFLVDQKGIELSAADQLMRDDEDDEAEYGQLTRETYYLADVFISLHENKYKGQLVRFVELLFGHPYHTPTLDEYAMYLASGSSLRSSQLGRQVGAAVISKNGDLIGVGCNDVPRAGGGLYWCTDEGDARDHILKEDTNDQQKKQILDDLLARLKCADLSEHERKTILKGAMFFDITEFGRAVHAEMDAILSCSRSGVSVLGACLFTTTFPCHNCARHLIASGISRVVYIEPYVKSAALKLHEDAIVVVDSISKKNKKSTVFRDKIPFESFVGIGPRRYSDLFSLKPTYGPEIARKRDGKVILWSKEPHKPRLPMHPISYLQREEIATAELELIDAEGRRHHGSESTEAKVRAVRKASQRNSAKS